jgi:hypothetical protein
MVIAEARKEVAGTPRSVPLLVRRPEALAVGSSLIAWPILIGSGGHGTPDGHLLHFWWISIMVLATMGPFAIPLLRMVTLTNPWWTGSRAVFTAFGAFVLTWLVAALSLHIVAELLNLYLADPVFLAAALVAACGAACVRSSRQRRLESCLAVRPGRSFGSSSPAQQGVQAALACGWLCLLPMLAMLLLPESWGLMAALTIVGLAERTIFSGRRAPAPLAYWSLSTVIFVLPIAS